MRRIRLGAAVVSVLVMTASVASAQLAPLATPSSADQWALWGVECAGRIGGYYRPRGYLPNGLVARVSRMYRFGPDSWLKEAWGPIYDGFGQDYDWNMILRPVDPATCNEQGEPGKAYGRDCVKERDEFLEVMWNVTSSDWREKWKQHAFEKGVREIVTKGSYDEAKKWDDKTLWQKCQMDDKCFKAISSTFCVTAEVQMSREPREQEDDDIGGHILALHMTHECSVEQNALCGKNILVYGAVTLDGGHDEKPELHPLRALVVDESATGWPTFEAQPDFGGNPNEPTGAKKHILDYAPPPPHTKAYTIGLFSDWGKASGEGGSGSIAGYICEAWGWLDPTPPYVSIDGISFPAVKPALPVGQLEASSVQQWIYRDVMLPEWPVANFTSGSSSGTGPVGGITWSPDFHYGGLYVHPQGKGYRIYRVETKWDVQTVKGTPEYISGVALELFDANGGTAAAPDKQIKFFGEKKAGETLAGGKTAPKHAYYFGIEASTKVTVVGGLAADPPKSPRPLDNVVYELRVNGQPVPSTDFVVANATTPGRALVLFPFVPNKGKELRYTLSAKGAVTIKDGKGGTSMVTRTTNVLTLHVPIVPSVYVAANKFDYEVQDDGKKKRVIYKPTFHAMTKDFLGKPTKWTWFSGNDAATGKLPIAGNGTADAQFAFTDADNHQKVHLAVEDSLGSVAKTIVEFTAPEPTVSIETKLLGEPKKGVPQIVKQWVMAGKGTKCFDKVMVEVSTYEKIDVEAELAFEGNPFPGPKVTKPTFMWSNVEMNANDGQGWKPYSNFRVGDEVAELRMVRPKQGQGIVLANVGAHLTLFADATSTQGVVPTPEFRARLRARDEFGRGTEEWVYFRNWVEKNTHLGSALGDSTIKTGPWEMKVALCIQSDLDKLVRIDRLNPHKRVELKVVVDQLLPWLDTGDPAPRTRFGEAWRMFGRFDRDGALLSAPPLVTNGKPLSTVPSVVEMASSALREVQPKTQISNLPKDLKMPMRQVPSKRSLPKSNWRWEHAQLENFRAFTGIR
ncbi:hypothetical protein [Archangium sp.]|uniref:hypothetical protein n=1 Tax=Archangium sp. TaxID=1872627 RepID=UPI00286CCEDB|nr:hypothetical protein [Archangium sp.]